MLGNEGLRYRRTPKNVQGKIPALDLEDTVSLKLPERHKIFTIAQRMKRSFCLCRCYVSFPMIDYEWIWYN